jgi:hypothetical protein
MCTYIYIYIYVSTGISSYGISLTSLEQVFIKLANEKEIGLEEKESLTFLGRYINMFVYILIDRYMYPLCIYTCICIYIHMQ